MEDAQTTGAPMPDTNLFQQNISFVGPFGDSILVNMIDIDYHFLYTVRCALQYGTQMGACIIMAIVLVAFSSRPSMRKPLFILNLSSLILGCFRSLFLALYTVSPWTEIYAQFTGDISHIRTIDYSNSIAGAIFPLLMTVTVDFSLVLQAYAVCTQLNSRAVKIPLLLMSTIIILLGIGFRMAVCVTNIYAIVNAEFYAPQYLRSASLITNTIIIWWFMGIFMGKLSYTVWMRKKMGWRSMSVFQTLAIAGGCTMIIPSVFAVLQYVAWSSFPENGTWTLTTTALLLPLSTLWAKMAMEEEAASLRASRASQNSTTGNPLSDSVRYGSQASTVATYDQDRKNSIIPLTSKTATIDTIIECPAPAENPRDSTELDLEKMGVRVDRSYGIKGGRK